MHKPSKNEPNVRQIEKKHLPLHRVERTAQMGLRHPDNQKTRKPSII